MCNKRSRIFAFAAGVVLTCTAAVRGASEKEAPAFWQWAPTPPMGWNSYDAFGDTVTEREVMANANYVQEKLQSHGWKWQRKDLGAFEGQFSAQVPAHGAVLLRAVRFTATTQ